jgi:autoinducer 2-degrading protein
MNPNTPSSSAPEVHKLEIASSCRHLREAGFEAAFLDRVMAQARTSLEREPECRHFDVCQGPNDERRVFLYELYVGDAAFADHLRSPHFGAFDAVTRAWIDDKKIERWTRR